MTARRQGFSAGIRTEFTIGIEFVDPLLAIQQDGDIFFSIDSRQIIFNAK